MLPKMPPCFNSKAFFSLLTFVAVTSVFFLYIRGICVCDSQWGMDPNGFVPFELPLGLSYCLQLLCILISPRRWGLCRRNPVKVLSPAGFTSVQLTRLELLCLLWPHWIWWIFGALVSPMSSANFFSVCLKLGKENIHKSPSFIASVQI